MSTTKRLWIGLAAVIAVGVILLSRCIDPEEAWGAIDGDVLILIFAIMYFLLIRPQQNARKKHQEMVSNVRRGDIVVTSGGIVGKVTKVLEGDDSDKVMVEIAESTTVKVVKATLSDVKSKTQPAANDQ